MSKASASVREELGLRLHVAKHGLALTVHGRAVPGRVQVRDRARGGQELVLTVPLSLVLLGDNDALVDEAAAVIA